MRLTNFFASTAALNAGAVYSSSGPSTEPDAVGTGESDEDVATSTGSPSWAIITMTTPGPLFVAPSTERCTAEERAVWIGNQEFGVAYQRAAANAWGDSVDTVTNLAPAYPEISRHCLSCLGDATQCGRTNCFAPCLIDQSGEACRTCINKNCIPTMLTCTGAANMTELPLPPQPVVSPASPSTRPRPSTLPSIQVPSRSVSSAREFTPAETGPGRLRASTADANGEDAVAGVQDKLMALLGNNNAVTYGVVIAFIAALVGILLKANW